MIRQIDKLKKYRIKWLILFLLCGLIIFIFEKYYKVEHIIKIQFCKSLDEALGLIQVTQVSLFENHLILDTLFIISYSCLFWVIFNIGAKSLLLRVNKWQFIAFIPGFFDLLENIALVFLLETNYYQYAFFSVLHTATRLKWFFVIPFIIANSTIVLYYSLTFINKLFSQINKLIS